MPRTELSGLVNCIRSRPDYEALQLFLTDSRIKIDNNSFERTIRQIALNRKNTLYAGPDSGAENWATIASLIETCKLNAVDPLAYLTTTLAAIVNGHKSRIDELLPWNYPVEVFGLAEIVYDDLSAIN